MAIVVTTPPERAKDLKHRPAIIEAAAQGAGADQFTMYSYYRDELGLPEMGLVGRQLWEQSGLTPTDIQTAILYDHFTPPYTLIQLEELGFCGKVRPRISSPAGGPSNSADDCRSTPTAVSSVRPISTG